MLLTSTYNFRYYFTLVYSKKLLTCNWTFVYSFCRWEHDKSVMAVYSTLRILTSCWLQVMETTFWPQTRHHPITQERSQAATLTFTTKSMLQSWGLLWSNFNPSLEWVDVPRTTTQFDLVWWIFWCVCCFQVETPPLSPYPQQSKPSFLRQKLSSQVYVSPCNRDTPPPRSPIVSYTFHSSTSKVCEHPIEVMGFCFVLFLYKCSFCFPTVSEGHE